MKKIRFATKLFAIILCVSLLSMSAVSAFLYTELLDLSDYSQKVNIALGFSASDKSEKALIKQAESYLSQLSISKSRRLGSYLKKVQKDVEMTASYVEALYENPNKFISTGRKLPLPDTAFQGRASASMMVAKDVKRTPVLEKEMLLVSNAERLFGSIFSSNPDVSCVYLGTQSGIYFRYTDFNVSQSDYDPRKRFWYDEVYNSDKPVWIETYVSAFSGNKVISSAQAYKDASGRKAGVVAVDIPLKVLLEDIIDSIRIGKSGYTFLLDNKGHYLAHPHNNDFESDVINTAHGEYKRILTDMVNGKNGIRRVTINGTDYYMAYAYLPITGWSLGIAVEYEEIISGALNMKRDIDSDAVVAKERIGQMLSQAIFNSIILSCIICIAVLILTIIVSRSLTRPIVELTENVIEVGRGNLDTKIIIDAKDEIGVLATNFNKMTRDLKKYIRNLSKVTIEKERINSDLRIATGIQSDMLPKIFPNFANRDDLQMAVLMRPAKEVGGDFYDFYFLDSEHSKIALVIADVSGKGVPAALFMVIAKVLIKNNRDLPVNEVLAEVNKLLCADNNSNMFVTAYFSVLDLVTGKYTYAAAGHPAPLLYHKQSKEVSYLALSKDLPLGVIPNEKYVSQEITLQSGDSLLLYTDGVTEAFSANSEMYGKVRLKENMMRFAEDPAETVMERLYNTVTEHSEGVSQSDDITMLFCRFIGK
ncbi:MAG: SpoIIE family protein phosphatase [Fibromonadales bacterium]|nr:SpoIIE family protein phosphatase [Fibromonadales bacterium]